MITVHIAAEAMLPDDVIHEILSRVADDVAALFRCTMVCKPWRALVADPSFLQDRWPEDARHPSCLLGLFGRQRSSDGAHISGPLTFVPSPRSPLLHGRRFPYSFGPCTAGLLDSNAEPLASRQGLLLVRLSPRGDTRDHLAVCDMFAGTCDMLPQLTCVSFGIYGYAILTDADYSSKEGHQPPLSSRSNGFKVLLIVDEYNNAGRLHLTPYSCSSSDSSWSAPKKPFDPIERTSVHNDLVVCRGKVYLPVWGFSDICSLYTFELGSETIHVSSAKLSITRDQLEWSFYNKPHLNVTIDGKLSLVNLHKKSLEIEIWTQQDEEESGDGGADWLRTKVIKLISPTMLHIGEMAWTCLGERSGTFIILDPHKPVYIVNLDTGAIDEVPCQFCTIGRYNVVPFEMDWPAFFMSRLETNTKVIKGE